MRIDRPSFFVCLLVRSEAAAGVASDPNIHITGIRSYYYVYTYLSAMCKGLARLLMEALMEMMPFSVQLIFGFGAVLAGLL